MVVGTLTPLFKAADLEIHPNSAPRFKRPVEAAQHRSECEPTDTGIQICTWVFSRTSSIPIKVNCGLGQRRRCCSCAAGLVVVFVSSQIVSVGFLEDVRPRAVRLQAALVVLEQEALVPGQPGQLPAEAAGPVPLPH